MLSGKYCIAAANGCMRTTQVSTVQHLVLCLNTPCIHTSVQSDGNVTLRIDTSESREKVVLIPVCLLMAEIAVFSDNAQRFVDFSLFKTLSSGSHWILQR